MNPLQLCRSNSAKFASPQKETGRRWNIQSQQNKVAATHGEGDLDLSSSAMAMSSSEPDSSTSFLSVTSPPPASDPDAERPGEADAAEPAERRPGDPEADRDLLDAGDAEREPDLDRGDLEVFLVSPNDKFSLCAIPKFLSTFLTSIFVW